MRPSSTSRSACCARGWGRRPLGPRPSGRKRTSCERRWMTANSGTATSRTPGPFASPPRFAVLPRRAGRACRREPSDAAREAGRSAMSEAFDVNDNSDVYYAGTYWNDFEVVRRRINGLISGEPTRVWHEHFALETQRTFKRALILNCGNGWVERELVEHGLIAEGVGIDYAQSLVDEAAAAAAAE